MALTARRNRPLVDPLLTAVGVIHTALTPVLFGRSVRSVIDGGVIAAIETDPKLAERRGLGFWYASSGLVMIAYGWALTEREGQPEPLPASLRVALAALSAWGWC